jgi:actin-related protein
VLKTSRGMKCDNHGGNMFHMGLRHHPGKNPSNRPKSATSLTTRTNTNTSCDTSKSGQHSLSQEPPNNAMSTPVTPRHTDYFGSRPVPRSRPSGSLAATTGNSGTPGSPRTPLIGRSISGQFASPGTLNREPEEFVIYELEPRSLSAGFAGESRSRCVHRFGYHIGDGRRVGDYREFAQKPGSQRQLDKNDERWSEPYELYHPDVRHVDLALMADRLERAVRQIHTEHLQLVSSRPIKAALVVPSLVPTPILEVALRVLFQHYAQPPSITLLTTPALSCVGAGLRNALVVEIGWEETVVTAVGEQKIVAERRSVRGGKVLAREMASLLETATGGTSVGFAFTENVMRRMAWCKHQLADTESVTEDITIDIPPPVDNSPSLSVPFSHFARPAEATFFDPSTDDHDLPLPNLMFKTLLALPVDLRALCVSRIVLTGPHSNIPGLKTRLLADVSQLIKQRGWNIVENYGSAANPLPKRLLERQANAPSVQSPDANGSIPISERPHDDLADRLSQQVLHSITKDKEKVVKGVVRGVETLGAWGGASLVVSLRVKGKGEVEREEFLRDSALAMSGIMA